MGGSEISTSEGHGGLSWGISDIPSFLQWAADFLSGPYMKAGPWSPAFRT